ncbi:hypothetical protein EHM92_06320, partial [bacterium]
MSLGVMVIVLTLLSSYFLTYENIISVGLQMSVVAIMAIGQMMVIISGGIDLAGIYAASEPGAIGAAQALGGRGMAGKVRYDYNHNTVRRS